MIEMTQAMARHSRDGASGERSRAVTAFLALALVLMVLTGCAAVGLDYSPIEPDAPEAWNSDLRDGLKADSPAVENLSKWWSTLNDPLLTQLIEQAVTGNLDLKEAKARVREARARRGISEAALFPIVDASGTYKRTRSSEHGLSGAGGGDPINDLYQAGFDAGWEIDVFGGIRRSVEAADADLGASEESLRDILVSLLAEVAINYVDARAYQTRLSVAEANIKAQEETYELVRSRHEAGLSDELALQQARYNLEDTKSQIPTLRAGMEAAKNRLAVLTGRPPRAVHAIMEERKPIPVTPITVAVGIPAETLRRRPDIRAAERQVAAQTARIGQAEADLYPKFNLVGSIGLESLDASDFFKAASGAWSFGPTIRWNIFDAGAIRKNIEVQTALRDQVLIGYESAVLAALEEVENALTAYGQEQLRRERLAKAEEAAERAVLLARDQYKAGLVDFSNVLDAERSLLSFQDQLAQSEGAVTSNLVTLYKALGGGWETLMPEGTPDLADGEPAAVPAAQ